MVRLLLILNLLAVFLLFLAVVNLYFSLRKIIGKVEEFEAEQLKLYSKLKELKTAFEKLENSLEFLQNQVKILSTGFRRKE